MGRAFAQEARKSPPAALPKPCGALLKPQKRTLAMTITVYGIPNCDTVKKARTWLEGQGMAYAFHDYKKQGADPARIAGWCAAAGLDKVLNRAGTTFRKLTDGDKAAAGSLDGAVALMTAQPSLIKRPIVEHPAGLLIGFKEAEWAAALG
jgi:Spx/MgsR family transcriptional regulator